MSSPDPDPNALLDQAVSEKLAVSMLAADASVPRPVEARFVARAAEGEAGAIWVQPSPRDAVLVKQWATSKSRVSVRYTVHGIGAGMQTQVVKLIRDYWLTETVAISALLLAAPTKVWVEQRDSPRYQLRNDGGGIRAKLSRRAVRPPVGPPQQTAPAAQQTAPAAQQTAPAAQPTTPAPPLPRTGPRAQIPSAVQSKLPAQTGPPRPAGQAAPVAPVAPVAPAAPARQGPGVESRATLWDLGLGGVGFICPFSRSLLETRPGEPFDVTIEFAGKRWVMPTRLAFARARGTSSASGCASNEKKHRRSPSGSWRKSCASWRRGRPGGKRAARE